MSAGWLHQHSWRLCSAVKQLPSRKGRITNSCAGIYKCNSSKAPFICPDRIAQTLTKTLTSDCLVRLVGFFKRTICSRNEIDSVSGKNAVCTLVLAFLLTGDVTLARAEAIEVAGDAALELQQAYDRLACDDKRRRGSGDSFHYSLRFIGRDKLPRLETRRTLYSTATVLACLHVPPHSSKCQSSARPISIPHLKQIKSNQIVLFDSQASCESVLPIIQLG